MWGERLRQGVRSVSCLDGGAVDAITAAARIHLHWRPAGFKSPPSKPSSKLECKEPEIFRRGRDIISSSSPWHVQLSSGSRWQSVLSLINHDRFPLLV